MRTREDLKNALRRSRMECIMRGHSWDVADVMEVLDRETVIDLRDEVIYVRGIDGLASD